MIAPPRNTRCWCCGHDEASGCVRGPCPTCSTQPTCPKCRRCAHHCTLMAMNGFEWACGFMMRLAAQQRMFADEALRERARDGEMLT